MFWKFYKHKSNTDTHSNSIDQDLIEAINNSDIEKFFMWDIRKDLYVR